MWPAAEHSFTFMTTHKMTDEEGRKQYIQGSRGGPETQYKLVYLIRFGEYVKKVAGLKKMLFE